MPETSDEDGGRALPTPARITSLQNDRIKAIRALEMRKVRRETGQFLAEGAALLVTAREHGWAPRTLVIGPEAGAGAVARSLLRWATSSGADCLDVSAAVLEKLSAKDNPQSLMAVFEQRWAGPPDPAAAAGAAHGVWVALEEIRDPGNLGTIIRTADAAGAAGVILVGQTCDPYARDAVRASMGSIFAVPITHMQPDEFLALAARWPGDVVGTHLSGKTDYRAGGTRSPSLLVMGNEGAGLSETLAAACKRLVRIPMAGRLDSLNLAVATALMLYEIRRPALKL